jgi:hypothetical protein
MSAATINAAPAKALPGEGRIGLRANVRHIGALVRRNALQIKQDPESMFDVLLMPVIFTLLFVYVFGGAISGKGNQQEPRVPQRAQPQHLQPLVHRVLLAQRGELWQRLLRPAERQRRREACAAGVQSAGLPARGLGRTVGQIGQHRPLPQRERVVQKRRRLHRVALLQRPRPLPRATVETVQVHIVALGTQPVSAAIRRRHRRMPQRPPQPPDERLHRAHRVRRRIAGPHLVDEDADRNRTPRP